MSATSNGTGIVDPASVRPRLAEAAAESLEDIRRVLLETATGANKNLWATVSCKHCGRAGRYEITVPDNKVRLDAIQALLHHASARPPVTLPPARAHAHTMPLLAITSSLHATADGLNDDDKVPTAQGGARWYAVRGILSRSA